MENKFLEIEKLEYENTASLINGQGNYRLNTLNSFISHPYADPNKLYEKLLELIPKKSYTRKEIIFAYENVIEYVKENSNLLDDVYDEIHHHLETINNEIDGPVKMLIKKN